MVLNYTLDGFRWRIAKPSYIRCPVLSGVIIWMMRDNGLKRKLHAFITLTKKYCPLAFNRNISLRVPWKTMVNALFSWFCLEFPKEGRKAVLWMYCLITNILKRISRLDLGLLKKVARTRKSWISLNLLLRATFHTLLLFCLFIFCA